MTQPDDPYDFDVAVSFAGEDREYVEEIVSSLRGAEVRVFYDSDYLAETWGEDLLEFFDAVYRKKSRYAIIFISAHYALKMWPRHERRSALARAMEERGAYVLPVRLDDSELDGLRPTVGFIDARRVGIDGIVRATLAKLQGATTPAVAITRVPRSEAERQLLLLEKPGGWEYLLFASELLRERDGLEGKYRDHEMRYGTTTGRSVTRRDLQDYLQAATGEAARLAGSLNLVMDPVVQERAFGPPGEPGDAERIVHLAQRWTSLYQGFMDWTARLRGTTVPSEYSDVVEAVARYSDKSIANYRAFVDRFVREVDQVPAAVASGRPLAVDLELVLEIPKDVIRNFDEALALALERERLG